MIGTKFYKGQFNNKDYADCAVWCNRHKAVIVDKGAFYECVAEEETSLTLEELQQKYTEFVQELIDAKAKEKGYDNGFAVCSYALSTNPKFKGEAEAFISWRDGVWETCYAILDKAIANEKYNEGWIDVLPTNEELINELPILNW